MEPESTGQHGSPSANASAGACLGEEGGKVLIMAFELAASVDGWTTNSALS